MTNINIPPEAVEAAAKTIAEPSDWGLLSEPWRDRLQDIATAAIRAALAAWPGMKTKLANSINVEPREQYLILPLNTENPDAEA